MAEARAAVQALRSAGREITIDTAARGIKVHAADDGLVVSFLIPHPRHVRAAAIRSAFRLKRAFVNKIFPAPPAIAVVFISAVIYVVVTAEPDSWWRNGWLAWGLWRLDGYLPFTEGLPVPARVGYLSAVAALTGFLLIMALERLVLRVLLSSPSFVVGAKSWSVKLRFALIKLLTLPPTTALTYSYQGALPRQPVPPLRDTVRRYLDSVTPLLDAEGLAKAKRMADEFLRNEGAKLQRLLVLKSYWAPNWCTDWWQDYVYLKGRTPLPINSNYYITDPFVHQGSAHQCARAATLIYHMLLFKRQLDHETLPPTLMNSTIPVCMAQYERMFSTTRIPKADQDVLRHWSSAESRHIAVLRRGHWFKVRVHAKDGRMLTAYDLEQQLEHVVTLADALPEPANGAGHVAAFTTENRTVWAEARERFFADGVNRKSLHAIESAIMVLNLTCDNVEDLDERAAMLLHGDGSCIWFDKTLSLTIWPSGRWGLNAEHSWADAPVVAHMMEYAFITTDGLYDDLDDEKRNVPTSSSKAEASPPQILPFEFDDEGAAAVHSALANAQLANADLMLRVFSFEEFGKSQIKKLKMSPDGFIQMALQLAYFRDHGCHTLTYEAAAVRLYRAGRTETVRVVTAEAAAFVQAMQEQDGAGRDRAKCAELLRTATVRHVKGYKDAMVSRGIDRHAFSLYVVSVGMGIESPFLQDFLKMPWKLSTSQQPQCQTTLREDMKARGDDPRRLLSPGGGFGPVADDGYGVSYMVLDDQLAFHVSSKRSCAETDSEAFIGHLRSALSDMKALFD